MVCVVLRIRNEIRCVFRVLSLVVLAWAIRLNGSTMGLTVKSVDQYCRIAFYGLILIL